jgi:hypothetical protein
VFTFTAWDGVDTTSWVYTTSALTDTVGFDDWVHLVGVFDAQKGEQRLYVNGVLKDSAARPAGSAMTGPATIGRSLWKGAPTEWWPGEVDDVRLYQGVMTGTEVAKLAEL